MGHPEVTSGYLGVTSDYLGSLGAWQAGVLVSINCSMLLVHGQSCGGHLGSPENHLDVTWKLLGSHLGLTLGLEGPS